MSHASPSVGARERGFAMVALLVGMSVAAIWMAALLPAWRQQAQRQREEDLIFRGEQYARAIVLYQDKNRGAFPPSVDVLVSGRYLRKKWKDPITNDEFVPLGTGVSLPGGQAPQQGQTPGRGQQPAPGRGGGPQIPGAGQQGGQPAGITGVRSKSTATSIKIYQQQQQYSLWPFDGAMLRQRMGRLQQQQPGGGRQGGPGDGRGGPGVGVPGRGGPGGGQPGRGGQGPGPGRGGFPPPPPTGRPGGAAGS
jgi:type II secretory pathway pseudopilin PulG